MAIGKAEAERERRLFEFPTDLITDVRITGGGYAIHLNAANGSLANSLLEVNHALGETTGPIRLVAKGVGHDGRDRLSFRHLEWSFGVVRGPGGARSDTPTQILDYLKTEAGNRPTDPRLAAIDNLLDAAYGARKAEITAVQVESAALGKRRFTSAADMLTVLGYFRGGRVILCHNKPETDLTVEYREGGVKRVLRERFEDVDIAVRDYRSEWQMPISRVLAGLTKPTLPRWQDLAVVRDDVPGYGLR